VEDMCHSMTEPCNAKVQGTVPCPETSRLCDRSLLRKPAWLENHATFAQRDALNVITGIPMTYTEAMSSRDSRKWQEAMNEEMLSLEENHVWKLVKLPPGCKAIDNRWVYCVKQLSDGSDDLSHLITIRLV